MVSKEKLVGCMFHFYLAKRVGDGWDMVGASVGGTARRRHDVSERGVGCCFLGS